MYRCCTVALRSLAAARFCWQKGARVYFFFLFGRRRNLTGVFDAYRAAQQKIRSLQGSGLALGRRFLV
jgi:hypothetical protein